MKVSKYAGLECLERASNFENKKAVILLHGYGANMYDLAGLAEYLDPTGEWQWYFPQAPLAMNLGYGQMGFAWFHLDRGLLEQSQRSHANTSFQKNTPSGFEEASRQVIDFIEALGLDNTTTFLGGFSQGAMISMQSCLTGLSAVKNLMLLSGTLVNEEAWKKKIVEKKDLNIFQSHGQSDPILPFHLAKNLISFYQEKQVQHEWVSFAGGHEIPEMVLKQLSQFIRSTM